MEAIDFINEIKSRYYNAENLAILWFDPIQKFIAQHINESFDGEGMLDILSGHSLKRRLGKAAMLGVCARFYTNNAALKAFFNSLPTPTQKVIEKAVWKNSVNYKEINRIYGQKVIDAEEQGNYYKEYSIKIGKELKDWKNFFYYRRVWDADSATTFLERADVYFSLPEFMQQIFGLILPKPEGYYLVPRSLPKGSTVFSVEKTIFREMPLILSHYVQGKIRYTQKGYPNLASSRKMEKSLALEPFPGKGPKSLRALLIAGLFTDKFKLDSLSEATLTILYSLFSTDFSKHSAIPYLLSHLKRINSFRFDEFKPSLTDGLFSFFKEFPIADQGWLTFPNIYSSATFRHIQTQPFYSAYDLDKLTTADDLEQEAYDLRDHADMETFIKLPTLVGHIYLMAAFGLMEIAVEEDVEPYSSYYDGFNACRLTRLGAHLLGLEREYTPPKLEEDTRLSFDENAPIIRIQGNITLGDTMLEKYAEKVSKNRYQFSPGKFLKDCKSRKDLEYKITLFKKTIGQELPPFWNKYLEQLKENNQAIKSKSTLTVYKLPQENKELHRLVAQDKVLRSLVIKAEGFYVLVENKDKNKFKSRMKDFGFLIGR